MAAMLRGSAVPESAAPAGSTNDRIGMSIASGSKSEWPPDPRLNRSAPALGAKNPLSSVSNVGGPKDEVHGRSSVSVPAGPNRPNRVGSASLLGRSGLKL